MFREFLSRLLRPRYVRLSVPLEMLPMFGDVGEAIAKSAAHRWGLFAPKFSVRALTFQAGHRFFDDLLVPSRAGIPDSFEPFRLRGVLPHDQVRDLVGISFDRIEDGETTRIALSRADAEALSGLIRDYLSPPPSTAASSESADFLDGLTDERFKAMLDEARNGGSDLPKTRAELNAVIDEQIRSHWVAAQSDVGTRFA